MVKSVSTQVRLICSLTRAKTVGGSRVRVDSFVASPTSQCVGSLIAANPSMSGTENPPNTLEVALSDGSYPVSVKQTFQYFRKRAHGVGETNYPGDSLPLNPLKRLRDDFDFHTHG